VPDTNLPHRTGVARPPPSFLRRAPPSFTGQVHLAERVAGAELLGRPLPPAGLAAPEPEHDGHGDQDQNEDDEHEGRDDWPRHGAEPGTRRSPGQQHRPAEIAPACRLPGGRPIVRRAARTPAAAPP
jgi:hypothetical protein